MEQQSPIVQRAVQRLRDKINRRETNLDLDALKAVLVEMHTQKERADRLEKQFSDECETSRNLEKLHEMNHAERTAYEIAYSALSDVQQGLTEPSHEGGLTRAEALEVVSGAIGRIHHLLGKD